MIYNATKCADSEMVSLLKNHDPKGTYLLYEKFSVMLFMFVSRVLSYNSHATELILKNVFNIAIEEIANYDATKFKFFTWIMQITRKQVQLYLSKQSFTDGCLTMTTKFSDKSVLKMIYKDCKPSSKVAQDLDMTRKALAENLRMELFVIREL